MGLKRFVSSVIRKSPISPSEPGKLAAGCPAVFAQDGTWSAKFNGRSAPEKINDQVIKQESGRKDADLTSTTRLPRKRSWLQRRVIPS
ncbi:uncharacterized protein LOC6610065 [Drosophila sechellia]|uniref:GD11513 n=2 Tax=melanogaster subgroup TaxID=32351 RepID=B4QEN5_DROSI|nr:uncharacterized protein LOC6610065 [Drosophila sechellia]EDW48694.1 GM22014 [Drosophila sechellia]EDX07909.1 GD11513 [Drosophila simulans]